jgi:integrase
MAGSELVEGGGTDELREKNLPVLVGEHTIVPAFIAAGGERAGFAFVDFFTAQIRNRNVRKGKTPILASDEARQLLDSIDVSTPVGLRDRALIALLIYTFARVSAAIAMNVRDYYPQGKRWWVRLHEKGGKQHEMPAHHLLEAYIDEYLAGAGLGDDKASPLFPTAKGRTGTLTKLRMNRTDALRMIWRRARAAGIKTELGCHSFRATGITVYLQNGGVLEHAQQMAAHESARTTKLYDRRNDQVTLDEIERIVL